MYMCMYMYVYTCIREELYMNMFISIYKYFYVFSCVDFSKGITFLAGN